MAKIVVVGSLNIDIVAVASRLPSPGETLLGTDYFTAFGGKGANQAYAAAKLGGDVAMVGRVGMDDHGKQTLAHLADAGCDVFSVRQIEGSTGVALILVGKSGQNSIVVVPGANERFFPDDVRQEHMAWTGSRFALFQLETPIETVIEAAQVAKHHGAMVLLDPAPAPIQLPLELLRYVDIITPNESEAALLADGTPHALDITEARRVAHKLQAMGVRTIIIKLGAQGCLVADGEVTARHIPAPAVEAVDTTAAGDVFNAALAVALSEGSALPDACWFANHAAALSVTRRGAQISVPSRVETDAMLMPGLQLAKI